jgi:transcriptional regulator with XRE-family HTH domain
MTPAYTVSPQLIAREDFRAACLARDFGEMFKLMRKYDGASQDRISSPVEGLTQSRVSRIMRGSDHVASLDVIARIADALHIPGDYLGLAPRAWEAKPSLAVSSPQQNHSTATIIDTHPVQQADHASAPAGAVVDRRVSVEIEIGDDGWSVLTYRHELHNGSDTPFTRLSRELWFEHTAGPIDLRALPTSDDRNVIIQRIHDAAGYTKFACQLFPALQPGESMTVAYTARGGQFVSDHYWRQSIVRPTGELSLRLRHQGYDSLTGCSAVEERPDGSEVSATESLTWQRDGDGVAVDLTRRNLRPNQSVTLRWEVPRDAS